MCRSPTRDESDFYINYKYSNAHLNIIGFLSGEITDKKWQSEEY